MSFEDAVARYFAARLHDAHDVEVTRCYRIPGGASRETWSVDLRWLEGGGKRARAGLHRPARSRGEPGRLRPPRRVRLLPLLRRLAGAGAAAAVSRDRADVAGAPVLRHGAHRRLRVAVPGAARAELRAASRRPGAPHVRDSRRHRRARRSTALPATESSAVPAPDGLLAARARLLGGRDRRATSSSRSRSRAPAFAGCAAIRRRRAQRVSVVHGDYRTGNFLYRGAEIRGDPRLGDGALRRSARGPRLVVHAGLAVGARRQGRRHRRRRRRRCASGRQRSGLRVDRAALHWWQTFSCVKAQGIWLTGAREFADGRAQDIMLAFTSYWLINAQDRFLLQALGRL